MNAKILKKRKKPLNFSPFTREKAIKLALMFAVVATCGFGGVGVGRYLLSDPKYAIKHIIVHGNQRLSKQEIVRLSLLTKGQNIFRARIHQTRERLLKLALVDEASVSRFMPDIIVIEVVERSPRARLSDSDRLLADYSGVILSRCCSSAPEKLPLIVGVDTSSLSVGDRCSQPTMAHAMRVLQLCRSPRLAELIEVARIDSSQPDDLRLYLKEGTYTKEECGVRVGGEDFEQRLANLAEILKGVAEKHKKKARWIDLTLNYVRF